MIKLDSYADELFIRILIGLLVLCAFSGTAYRAYRIDDTVRMRRTCVEGNDYEGCTKYGYREVGDTVGETLFKGSAIGILVGIVPSLAIAYIIMVIKEY